MTSSNIPHSVHSKLLNISRKEKRSFNELLHYYAIERFLFRLSKSEYKQKLVLKGGLLFSLWDMQVRATRDIDFEGTIKNDENLVRQMILEIISTEVIDDGLIYQPESLRINAIKEGAEYEGLRCLFIGFLGKAKVSMQIDIGFGDFYTQKKNIEYPVILDYPNPKLNCYSIETAVAEKVEAMIKLGRLNSRIKDFFDVWFLSHQFIFDGVTLAKAIEKTAAKRETKLPLSFETINNLLKDDASKKKQWTSFRDKNNAEFSPVQFLDVLNEIDVFISPVLQAISEMNRFNKAWHLKSRKWE